MLSTRFVFDPNSAKAGAELLDNIQLLTWCGCFEDAFELSVLLLEPGPWRSRADGQVQAVLSELLPWLSWMLGRDCPAVAGDPPRGAKALERFVRDREPVAKQFLQPAAIGSTVTAAALAAMPAPGFHGLTALSAVVSAELSQRLGEPGAAFTQLSGELHAAVLRAMVSHKQFLPIIAPMLLRSGLLVLLEEGHKLAAQRLAPHLPLLCSELLGMLPIAPFRSLMQCGELGLAAGLDAAQVARYRSEVAARSPETLIKPEQWSSWKTRLKLWMQAQAENGEIDFVGLAEQAEFSLPSSPQLAELAKLRKLLAKAAPEQELVTLEQRIGQSLPPSYREFLLTSNGLLRPAGVHLLPSCAVDWMHEIDPETVEIWSGESVKEASDAQYATYGSDQDCVHMRARHLRRALMISQSLDGDYWLLIPEVRFGAEWEAWFLGAKNPGAYRYRSFRELFEAQAILGAD